jgi:hypothetical protein
MKSVSDFQGQTHRSGAILSMMGRVRQTMQALFAWLMPVDEAQARRYLAPAEFALFQRMNRSERQHHLRVLSILLQQGEDHPALLTAALLHDVGKTRARFTIPERILVVLVKKFLPRRFDRWAAGEATGWRKPFAVSARHPEWGAVMLEDVGGDPLAVELIRHHQRRLLGGPCGEMESLLERLQVADDRS